MIAFPASERRLPRPNGGYVSWWEAGAGPQTLLWVHGLPLDSRSWRAQQDYFTPRTRNVFVDLRGYGRSAKLPAEVGSVAALYVDDLLAVIDAAGVRRRW